MNWVRTPAFLFLTCSLILTVAPVSQAQQVNWPGLGTKAQPAPKDPSQQARAHFEKGVQLQEKGKLNEAIAEYKQVIRLLPKNPMGYGQLAGAYMAKGDAKSAEQMLLKVAELDPKNAMVRAQLAEVCLQTNRAADAAKFAGQAVKIDPKDPRFHLLLGASHMQRNDVKTAAEEFRTVTQLDPKNQGAYFNLGLIYAETGEFQRAREVLAKAASLAPKDVRILGMQAAVEEKADTKNGPKKAVALYNKAIAANPKNLDIRFALGSLYERIGDNSKALDCYRKIIAQEPRHLPAKLNAARVYLADKESKYAKEGHRKAELYLEEAVVAAPNDSRVLSMLGLAELYQEKNSEAEKHYKQAIKLDADNTAALEGLAYIYQRDNKPKEAVEFVEKLAKLNPENAEMQLRLARIYDGAQDQTRAANQYKRIVDKFSKNTEAMAERANFLNRIQLKDKAAEQYRDILKLKPDDLKTQMDIALLYCWEEDAALREKAIPELEAAKKMALKAKPPKDANEPDERTRPFTTLAALYEKNNDNEKAAQQYIEALEMAPGDVQCRRSLGAIYEKDTANIDKAIEQYRAMIDSNPESQEYYILLANAVEKKSQKPEDVDAELRKYIEAKPELVAPRYALAFNISKREGDEAQNAAIKEYEEILKVEPDEYRANISLSGIYDKLNEPDKAIEQLKQVLDKDPNNGGALRAMQALVQKRNDTKVTDEWLAYLKTLAVSKEFKGGADIYRTITDEFQKANRAGEAVALLEDAAKKNPDDKYLPVALGACYDQAGQKEKAIAVYKKALEADGQNGALYKGIGNVYFSEKKYAEAVKNFREWQSRQFFFMGVDETQIRIAQCLEYLGKTDQALEEYEKLAAGAPDNQVIKDAIRRLKPERTPLPATLMPGAAVPMGPEPDEP